MLAPVAPVQRKAIKVDDVCTWPFWIPRSILLQERTERLQVVDTLRQLHQPARSLQSREMEMEIKPKQVKEDEQEEDIPLDYCCSRRRMWTR